MSRKDGKDRGLFERPKGSEVWWIRYVNEQGLDVKKKIGPKSVAKEALRRARNDVAAKKHAPGMTDDEPAEVLTVAELVQRYEVEARTNNANWKHYERYGRYWVDFCGGVYIDRLKPADVERYKAKRLAEGTNSKTINKEVGRLKRLLNLAIRDGLLAANPIRAVRKLAEEPGRVRYLADDEELALAAEMTPWEWLLVEIAFRTGLRQGEQFTALRSQVDLKTGLVTVTKTKSRKARHIPLSKKLLVDGFLGPFQRQSLRAYLAANKTAWLFPNQTGTNHVDAHNFYARNFQPALKRAGIANFTWHDLRHTFASRLVMAGADLLSVKELMGHASLQQTQIYAHLRPGRLQEVVNLI